MAVTQVGTPAATVYTATNGTNTPTLAWSGTQPRTAGDILVLVVTAAATTSVTAPATPSGWTAGPATGNTGTTPHTYTAIFWKVATSGDAVPAISVTTSGTTRCGFSLFELAGAENILSPVDTTGTYASGSGAASITSMTVTGSTNVAYSGEYGFAAFAHEMGTASTVTYTPGTGWTNFGSDASTSTRDHNHVDYTSSAPTVNVAASDAATTTTDGTGYAAGALITFAPPHDPGPVLTPSSQPPGVRVVLQLAGQALASVIPQVTAAPPTPAPLYPLQQPVDGYRRTARPPRGIVRGIAGAALFVSVLGPPVTPLHQPVHAARPLPPAGRVISRTGVFSGTGPGVILRRRPVTPAVRVLPPRGTVIARAGVFSGTGPPVAPLRRPVTPAVRPLPPRGKVAARTGVFSGKGPALTPLHQPVRARQPLPLAGQVTASSLPAVSSPAPFILPSQPAGIRTVFVRAGDVRSAAGVYSGKGPALTPLTAPVRARQALPPPRGIAVTRAGTFSGTGPAVTRLRGPVTAALRPRPPRGTASSRLGAYSGQGPAVTPLRSPVRAVPARLPSGRAVTLRAVQAAAPPPAPSPIQPRAVPWRPVIPAAARGGWSRHSAGIYAGQGPALYPLRRPVKAQPANLQRGHAAATAAYVPPPVPVTGPPLYPLHQPVRARQPFPGPGRAMAIAQVPYTLPSPTSGPPIPPRARPVRAVIPQPIRGGWSRGTQGTYSGLGAPFQPPSQPAGILVAFLRTGHIQSSRPAPSPFTPTAGPSIPPRAQPVRATIPAPHRGGYALTRTGTYSGQGPAVRLLTGPLQARQPLPPRGRVLGLHQGVYSGQGPAPALLRRPVKAAQPLPPRGRVLGVYRAVTQVPTPTAGPPIPPRAQPVRGRLPLPAPGRAATMALLEFTPGAPVPAPIPPRAQPVRAVVPAPARGGHTLTRAGIYSGTGPALTPLHRPARTFPAQPRPGYIRSSHAVTTAPIPVPAPLHTPVTSHRTLPPAGRALGITRVTAVPPQPVTGPPVYPLHQPIRARQPRPAPGRAAAIAAIPAPPIPTIGPRIPPRAQPWRAVLPAPHQHGAANTFVPPPPPVQPITTALFGAPHQQWQWAAGGARLAWVTDGTRSGWPEGPSRNQP